MGINADVQVKTLEQPLESDDELSSVPLACARAHPAVRAPHDLFASAQFCAIVQLMVLEEAERTYASRVNASMTRAAEKVLSDAFQTSYKSANAGFTSTSYYFVESRLTEMTQKGTLDEVFHRNIEQWT